MARNTGRPLTPGEQALAAGMFGDALALDPIRIHRARWFPFQPRDVVMAPDGHIWCHPQGSAWREDFSACDPAMQGLLIHELTHVWQAQRGGRWFPPLACHPFCRYVYDWVPGRPFARYGIEQQAEIVRHAFLLRQGVSVPGKPGLADYEALLPFGRRG
jgi:hypothetical protein